MSCLRNLRAFVGSTTSANLGSLNSNNFLAILSVSRCWQSLFLRIILSTVERLVVVLDLRAGFGSWFPNKCRKPNCRGEALSD